MAGAVEGRRFALVLVALLVLGLVLATSLEAQRPLCGGRRATISSNDRLIHGTRGPDVIVAGRGPNVIFGGRGNDVICGGYGRDRIDGGRGNDTIDGKKDADLVHGGRGSDEVDGGAGRDRVRGDSGNDTARGGPGGRDDVEGGLGDDTVDGGRGAFDLLSGGIGRDRIDGGPGSHDIASYRSAGGPVAVDLASGSVTGAEQERLVGVEDVMGGSGDDLLATSELTANRLEGGPGDDRLLGSLQRDQAFGGPGSDECFGSFSVAESCGSTSAGAGTRVELYESLSGPPSIAIAGDEEVDQVTVGFSRGRYLVRAGSANPVLLGDPRYAGNCNLLAGAVACRGQVRSILVSLGAGNDTISFERSLPPAISVTIDGGPGSDWLRGSPGGDTLYAGDDADPDRLQGGGGDDALFGVNILHPRRESGAATMLGGGGDDLMVGGQPCGGDLYAGGPGGNDSASFARVRNEGVHVVAKIGGAVSDPDVAACAAGRIARGTEKIEGSPGPDVLIGNSVANTLLGRGGSDRLDGRGGPDRCIGGRGGDRASHCEYLRN
ncbi:MAG TPA: calcium-binding protein [Solirubrobacterales bacterium]|nr:calcium-binding protein [Solirubrobacterales bacterium]